MVVVENGVPSRQVEEAVLFAFDDFSIPFRQNLELHLINGKDSATNRANVYKTPIVLRNGAPGDPDEHVHYYGTTMRIEGQFRMWYIGRTGRDEDTANNEGYNGRLCYAVSNDGVNWEKPELGLVEFNGSKRNNLVAFPQDADISAGTVLYDPEDPDANRRFKINYELGPAFGNKMSVAYSPDGLNWAPSPDNPVGPVLEQTGLIKFNGCYFVNGQGPGQAVVGRSVMTYASYDFEHWTPASVLSLSRSPGLAGPQWEDRAGLLEQVHLGAALHDRGNVILGVYGMWHGTPSHDRRYVTMDLGFVISHDAMHFHEPVRGFRFIPAREEHGSTVGFGPALMQGQGMENFGDKTFYWYSLWRSDGQVRLATWARDRLGYVKPSQPNSPAMLITCPFRVTDESQKVFLNVDGLGEYAGVRVEVLDLEFRPVAGYSGEGSPILRESGLRVPVRWKEGNTLPKSDGPVRLLLNFGQLSPDSIRPEDARLYALYVGQA